MRDIHLSAGARNAAVRASPSGNSLIARDVRSEPRVGTADPKCLPVEKQVGTPVPNSAPDDDRAAWLTSAMERYADGDDAAFGEIYDALAGRIYAFLLRQTRDPARAEDLL